MEKKLINKALEQQIEKLQQLTILQKQWEEAFKEREKQFNIQYQSIPVPASSWQKQGDDFVLIRLNRTAETLLGEQSHNLIGCKARDLFRDKPNIVDSFTRCFNTKSMQQQEMEHIARDGKTRYFMVNQLSLPPNLVLMYLEDISEHKKAHITLKESHDRLEKEISRVMTRLHKTNEKLQYNIAERKKTEDALRQDETKFRALAKSTSAAIFIYQDNRFTYVNPSWEILTGYSRKEASTMCIRDIIHPDMYNKSKGSQDTRFSEKCSSSLEVKLLPKNAKIKWVDYFSTSIKYEGRPALLGICFDITIRKTIEISLQEKERKLEEQDHHLAEMNSALKILFEYRDKEKNMLEKQIVVHVKKLIFPYLDKIEKMNLNSNLKTYIGIIRDNIKNFTSPFAYTLSAHNLDLTPTEIQIADLIKQGQSSKEIASLMNVSTYDITFHRANIRRKLGLSGKKTNLRNHLQSLAF